MDTENAGFCSLYSMREVCPLPPRRWATPPPASAGWWTVWSGRRAFPAARGRGGVSATRACQELLPLMRRMAELDEQYQQLAHRIQGLDVGRVVAGTNYAAFYPWLSEVIAGFHHAYPGIRVELREGSSTQLGELVDHRRADFCLISQRPGRHEWVPLKDDQLMAILPPTHPLVEADRFPVERLRQEPFIEFRRVRRQITPGCSSSCRSGPRSASPPATAGPPLPWCGRGWASPY